MLYTERADFVLTVNGVIIHGVNVFFDYFVMRPPPCAFLHVDRESEWMDGDYVNFIYR